MKKTLKRLCTGFLALATIVTALPTTPVHAESKQYWTESAERVGIIEKVMNDGSIGSTFNEGMMKVEGKTAYCIDINTDFRNGYKTRADASSRMNANQISDVALSLEYVKQYGEAHKELNYKQVYLLEQCVVWQRLSVHLGWQCDNVRASYDEIPKATQDDVFSAARTFVKENKGRYECGGYIYSGEGQELGQFWAKLNVGNAKLKKTSSNASITDGNGNYSIAGATYGVFTDKDCTKQLATLTTDENGNTDVAEVKAGTVYIKELSAPAGYKVDKTVYSLIMTCIGFGVALLVNTITYFIFPQFAFGYYMFIACASFAVTLVFLSFVLPSNYSLGVNAGFAVMFTLVIILVVLAVWTNVTNNYILWFVVDNFELSIGIAFIIVIALAFSSYLLSKAFFTRKYN